MGFYFNLMDYSKVSGNEFRVYFYYEGSIIGFDLFFIKDIISNVL